MRKVFILILILILSISGFSTNYRVETAANGGLDANNGYSAPVATLSRAATLAILPGDSIIFGIGAFTHTTQANIYPQVSVRGADSTQTIINCTYSFTPQDFGKGCIVLLSATENTNGNQSISKLKLDGGLVATRGILIRARGNVLIEKVSIQRFFVNGVAMYANSNPYAQPTTRADGNVIRYSQIRNCGNGHSDWQGGSLIDCYGQSNTQVVHNVLINIDRLDHNANILSRLDFCIGFQFEYNESYKNDIDGAEAWNFHIETWNIQGGAVFAHNNFHGGGIAIDLGGADNVKGNYTFSAKIYDNTFVRTTVGDESKGTHAAIHLEAHTNCSDVFAYENYTKNFSYALLISDGTAGAASTKSRLYYFNNVAEDCQWQQTWAMPVVYIDNSESASSNWSDIYLINNTFTGKAGKNVYGIYVNCVGTINGLVVKNNIFYNLSNSQGFLYSPNVGTRLNFTLANNLSYLCGNSNNPNISGTIPGYSYTNQIKQNPLFMGVANLQLQSISPARNTGQVITLPIIGRLPYLENFPDIGGYEYNPGISSGVILQGNNSITQGTSIVIY